MMKYYGQSVEISHNPNWHYIPDHCYRILIIDGPGLVKTNVLLNLININDQILRKFIYTSKVCWNQTMNCLLIKEKKCEL